jgi:hypothetical protein
MNFILKRLFMQYQDTTTLTFASRWMNLHGKVLIGSVKDKGLDVREDLARSYYYIREERDLPEGEKDREQWRVHSILLSQYRSLEARTVAKGAALFAMSVCLALVFSAGTIRAGGAKVDKVKAWFASEATAPKATGDAQ